MDIGVLLKALWPYLAVLYVLDCILVVRGGHLLLTGTLSRGFRPREAGLHLAGVFPWTWSVLTLKEPLMLSEAGLYFRSVPPSGYLAPPGGDDLEFLSWEQIRQVKRDGRKVVVDGKVVQTAPTGVTAGVLAGQIETILNAPAHRRSSSVEAVVAGASDLEAIRQAVDAAKSLCAALQYLSSLLFLLLFILIPLSFLARIPLSLILFESVLVLTLCPITLFFWWRAHRTLFPVEQGDRVEELMALTVFPVSLPHSFGKLTRRLFASYDSAALAAVLAPQRAGELLSREYIWTFAAASSGTGEDLVRMWEKRIEVLEKIAGEAGSGPLPIAVPSEGVNNGNIPRCPLCETTYRDGVEECADCRIPLMVPVFEREESFRPIERVRRDPGMQMDAAIRRR